VSNSDDCDDLDASAFPGGSEVCDGADNDCDSEIDEDDAADAAAWYADTDGDGYGDATNIDVSCAIKSGYVSDATDCDDTDAAVNPAATEVCDGADNDCDGSVDESDAADALTWYADLDGDGFGDAGNSIIACDAPTGFISNATDCDDTAATTHPGATDDWYDGIDEDRSEERDFNNLDGSEGVENGPSRPRVGTVPGRKVAILRAVKPVQIHLVIRAPTRPSLIGSPASPPFSTSASARLPDSSSTFGWEASTGWSSSVAEQRRPRSPCARSSPGGSPWTERCCLARSPARSGGMFSSG
jgi:hypothetical protein